MTRNAKFGLAAALALCLALAFAVFARRPAEVATGVLGPSANGARSTTKHEVAASGSQLKAPVPERDGGSAAASLISPAPTTTSPTPPADLSQGNRPARRAANASTSAATELTYVPASEPAPHNMTGDGFQIAAGARDPDLVALAGTVHDFRAALGENPVGNNAEITRALLGDNARHAQFLPPDMLKNDVGELLDRWGHPYYFHALSRTEMEVHSAGPDGVMWSADDQVFR